MRVRVLASLLFKEIELIITKTHLRDRPSSTRIETLKEPASAPKAMTAPFSHEHTQRVVSVLRKAISHGKGQRVAKQSSPGPEATSGLKYSCRTWSDDMAATWLPDFTISTQRICQIQQGPRLREAEQ